MEKLFELLDELESRIPDYKKQNLSISKSSAAWHIEHSLITTIQIIGKLKNSNPQDYKWKFNLIRMVVFTMGNIPRGKGKAPKSVLPEGEINIETLKKNIEFAKTKIKELNTLNPNNYFEHPYFGKLNLKATIHFLEIHANHHIKIIKDII